MTKKYLTEEEARAIVRDEMSKMLSPIINSQPKKKYLPTSKAWKELGFNTQQDLYDAVKSELLRIGKEVRDISKPGSVKSSYSFDIQACLQRLAQPPEKRSSK